MTYPDEMLDTDAVELHLRTIWRRMREAYDAHQAEPANADLRNAFESLKTHWKAERFELLSEPCETCSGEGEIMWGVREACLIEPAYPVWDDCPDCKGRGRTIPDRYRTYGVGA